LLKHVILSFREILKKKLNQVLSFSDLVLTRKSNFNNILKRSEDFFLVSRDGYDFELLRELILYKHEETKLVLEYMESSLSQLRQDLLVLWLLDFPNQGVFVEFGATDGIDLSNTYLLECTFGWTGVLAEPAKVWQHDLVSNRKSKLDFRAVSERTGDQLVFHESHDARFSSFQKNSELRYPKEYIVQTVSLTDLLLEHNLPKVIDYLSIDTEGTEFDVLKNFDFNSFKFKVVTIEFSDPTSSKVVVDLMLKNGYQRIFNSISKFEDWFIHPKYVTLPTR
jgi:FkbM family methyltransferase